MKTLYEIDQSILALADPETGEITDFEKLEELQLEREAKIENVALWYKNLIAEAEMVKAEKQALAERQQACEKRAEGLKRYLETALAGQKFTTPKVQCAFRSSTSVHIIAPEQLATEYLRIKTEPDKKAISEAIKNGKEVEGAELVTGLSLSIK